MPKSEKAAPAKKTAPAAKKSDASQGEQAQGRYVGQTSGLRVAEFQNKTLAANAKQKLTDEQLATLWREEFPKAMPFDERMVRRVRSLYNAGKHKNEAPAQPLVGYDADGNKIPPRGSKKADASAKTPTAKAAKQEAAPVKKFKKTKASEAA